jgi:predicted nucleic acid-binding protein
MIILDTNVISEPLRQQPNADVVQWIDNQSLDTLYLSSVTVAELYFGMESLPTGRRRDTLLSRLRSEILPLFRGRILPFDVDSAKSYGALMSRAQSNGFAIGAADGYIAAIATSCSMRVATRDTKPFTAAGIEVINPWELQL